MKTQIKIFLFTAILNMPIWANAYYKPDIKDTLVQKIDALEKGDQVPDLEFTHLVNSKLESIKLSDFRGKIVILDFWATWCVSCISAFPKLNELQKKFKDDLQIIGITYQDSKLISDFFKQRVLKQNLVLDFPTATANTELQNYFPHQSISHVVWISDEGKVLEITGSKEVNEDNIQKIINKEIVKMAPKKDRAKRNDIDFNAPFVLKEINEPLYEGEGVTEGGIRYKSIITKKIDGISSSISNYTGRIIATNVFVESLFRNAFQYENLSSGEFLFTFPLNKIKWQADSNTFYHGPFQEINTSYSNTSEFCYELLLPDYYKGPKVYQVPNKDLRFIALNIMKQDMMKWTKLRSYIEPIESKVLVLSLIDSTKIISPDEYEKSEVDPGLYGGTYKNMRMLHFKRDLHVFLQNELPLIDETNYVGLVNFKLEAKLSDVKQLSKELLKYGLKLEESTRVIPMLIVKK